MALWICKRKARPALFGLAGWLPALLSPCGAGLQILLLSTTRDPRASSLVHLTWLGPESLAQFTSLLTVQASQASDLVPALSVCPEAASPVGLSHPDTRGMFHPTRYSVKGFVGLASLHSCPWSSVEFLTPFCLLI